MLLLVEEETFILEIKIKGVGLRELLDQLLPLSVPFRQTIYGRGTAIVNPLGRPGWLFFLSPMFQWSSPTQQPSPVWT